MRKICNTFVGLATLTALAVPALHAQSQYPGEAAMVIHYCGKPNAENHTTSPITGNMQRDLYYGDAIIHFAPIQEGWAFTSAWEGNLPISRRALEARMPCFHEAMLQVAARPSAAVDPTIAMQSITPPIVESNSFGMPFLWLIVALVIVLIVLAVLPSARREQRRKTLKPEEREFRKPGLFEGTFQAKSRNPSRLDL
jgi:hypothetical protein